MIELFKQLKEWLKNIKSKKQEEEEIEEPKQEEQPLSLVPNVSGSILIEFDAETGDFGVMASVDDTSETCVKILSLLMVHMATGDITPFVYESLVGWADGDEEKLDFNERLGAEIIALTTEITEDKAKSRKTAAIKASEVFNYRRKDQ